MKLTLKSLLVGTAGLACTVFATGCRSHATPVALSSGASTAVVATAATEELPTEVNGPEMTQSVPPPPQVAANPNAIEIVQHLPPVPAHVTQRHKKLSLVKYQNKYWLQDVDHHLYAAARDNNGHYYAATYLPSTGAMYPLYYDSARDDYYRASSDADHHYFRSYEDEPNYVYYYDRDPIYRRHGRQWNADYEPIIVAPVYSVGWGVSIPIFAASVFLFPRWHSQWWVSAGWSNGDDTFVDISFGRPYFHYYSVPSHYPFVYANTLYVANPGWRTNPVWYSHNTFVRAAYQSGSYRSFSGYGRAAAPGTLAASYAGTRAFTRGINPAPSGFAGRAAIAATTNNVARRANSGSFNSPGLNLRGMPGINGTSTSLTRTAPGNAIRGATGNAVIRAANNRGNNLGQIVPGRTTSITRAPAGRSPSNTGSFAGRRAVAPPTATRPQQRTTPTNIGTRPGGRVQPGAGQRAVQKPIGGMQRGGGAVQKPVGGIPRGGGVQKSYHGVQNGSGVQRGGAAPAQRTNPAVQQRGNAPAQRSNPAGQMRGNAPVQRSNPAGQQRGNAPAQRSNPAGQMRGNAPAQRSNPAGQQRGNAPAQRPNNGGQRGGSAPQKSGGGQQRGGGGAPQKNGGDRNKRP